IMLPRSMGFKADTAVYNPVTDEPTAQTYVARNVSPTQALGFTLTGAGQLPRDTQNPAQGSATQPTGADTNAAAAVDANDNPDTTKFGGGMGKPLDPDADHDTLAKYKWWILGGLALLLAGAAGILLRRPAAVPVLPAAPTTDHQTALRRALKEELFALETDRLQKKISDEEYAAHKNALDFVLLRALTREGARGKEPETR
ncbi:MAG: carboxypeptidase regulatory-like domain-containing protein, partial [Acidobacteriota bacterium]|nr:carboxypeptidase regulatory-like domain-containing protein [Acidobacteriota bacterium]